MRNIEKYNPEHYRDPTATEAIHNADKQPENVNRFIRVVKKCAKRHGLEVVGRIAVKDKKTGRTYL